MDGASEAGSACLQWVLQVLLVSSSRYPDQWIVPGGGMEPEEEPGGAAVREVYEEVRWTVVCIFSFHTDYISVFYRMHKQGICYIHWGEGKKASHMGDFFVA